MSYNNIRILKSWLKKACMTILMLFIFSTLDVFSQDITKERRNRNKAIAAKSLADTNKPVLTDSLAAQRDSIHRADSIQRADSLDLLKKSSLDAPAFTTARDSIVEDFSEGRQIIHYYGDVSVSYGNMKMTADYMEYDLKTGILYARGTTDTTGTTVGKPVMEQGGKSYTMDEVRYNFNTQKARITNMVTQEQDGILHGKNIKMMPDRSINITKGKYTVCDCEEPH